MKLTLLALLIQLFSLVTVAQPAPSPEAFENEVAFALTEIPELTFIRRFAEKRGYRAYLLGGTATALGDKARRKLQGTFTGPYDYFTTFGSIQDLDIVISGNEQQTIELQTALKERFPHHLPSDLSKPETAKTAWEIRVLTGFQTNKEPLLDNPDYLDRHNDSFSTGMIEVTTPEKKMIIRDLKDWKNSRSRYFEDLRVGRLHYLFSPRHDTTQLARLGMNLPILSAIRYAIKSVQFEPSLEAEDIKTVSKIIRDFRPSELDPKSYPAKWIERNSKKLIQHAVNLQHSWELMEALGLRKKLIALGDPTAKRTLAWYLSRRPLVSAPVGARRGRTAAELGITRLEYAIDTIADFERIFKAPRGELNIFQNDGADGVLLNKVGQSPEFAFEVEFDPSATERSDFLIEGNSVRLLNKSAVRVVESSYEISVAKFFAIIDSGISAKREPLLNELRAFVNRRNLPSTLLDLEKYYVRVRADLLNGVQLSLLTKNWFGTTAVNAFPEVWKVIKSDKSLSQFIDLTLTSGAEVSDRSLTAMIEAAGKAEPALLEKFAKEVLTQSRFRDHTKALSALIKASHNEIYRHHAARYAFVDRTSLEFSKILEEFIELAAQTRDVESLSLLAKYAFASQKFERYDELLNLLIEKSRRIGAAKPLGMLAKYVFAASGVQRTENLEDLRTAIIAVNNAEAIERFNEIKDPRTSSVTRINYCRKLIGF